MSLLLRKSGFRMKACRWKQRVLCSRGGDRQTLLSPLISHSLIGVCSSQEYRYPGEKTSPFFARKAVLFPSVLANARVSLWIIEKGAQCTLCIVEVSKDLCHHQLHQNGRSVFRVRGCPRLALSKSALILSAKYETVSSVSYGKIRDLIPRNDFNITLSFSKNTSRSASY